MENKKIVIPTIFALILITLLLVFGPTATIRPHAIILLLHQKGISFIIIYLRYGQLAYP
jgi:hypothetical protein